MQVGATSGGYKGRSQAGTGKMLEEKKDGIFKEFSNTEGKKNDFFINYSKYKNDKPVKNKDGTTKWIKNEKIIPDYLKKIK